MSESAVFVHLSSESCDHYHIVLDGPLTQEEATAKAKELIHEDDEYLYVEAIARWPEDRDSVL